MGGLLHLVQRGGTGRGRSPPRPLLVVPNVTAHPSTASVPITVLLCNGPLICGFNVPVKALRHKRLPFHVCQVVTVVMETAQLVLNNFQTFNVVNWIMPLPNKNSQLMLWLWTGKITWTYVIYLDFIFCRQMKADKTHKIKKRQNDT